MKAKNFKNLASAKKCLILFIMATMLIAAGGCDFLSGIASKFTSLFSNDEKDIQTAYDKYLAAKNAGDIEALKKLITREKSHGLEGENAPQILKFIKALSPPGAKITETHITGDRATLAVQSEVEGGVMKGEVSLLREDGRWKISEEKWDMKIYPKPIRLEGVKKPLLLILLKRSLFLRDSYMACQSLSRSLKTRQQQPLRRLL